MLLGMDWDFEVLSTATSELSAQSTPDDGEIKVFASDANKGRLHFAYYFHYYKHIFA